MNLNVGCGQDIRFDGDWINMDYISGPGVDVVHDIVSLPWPFRSGEFDYILCSHVLEHVFHWERLLPELYRIMSDDCILEIRVPYMSFHGNHVRQFDETGFSVFIRSDRRKSVRGCDADIMFDLIDFKINRILWLHNPKLFHWFPKMELVWKLRKVVK